MAIKSLARSRKTAVEPGNIIDKTRQKLQEYEARQEQILHTLAALDESQPPADALPDVLGLLRRMVERLRAGEVPLEDLLVTQRLSRELHEYKRPTPLSTAVTQLESLGKPVRPGQVVKFLYTRGKPGVLAWRAGQPLSMEGVAVDKYIQLIARAASNVLQPLGATERGLMDVLGASGQLPLGVGLNTLLAQVDYGVEEIAVPYEEEDALEMGDGLQLPVVGQQLPVDRR